jgi:hypothetical protein
MASLPACDSRHIWLQKEPTLNLPMLLAHLAAIFRMVPTAPSLSGTVALTLTLTLFCQIVNSTVAGTSWPMLPTFFALLWCCQFNCLSCQCDWQRCQHNMNPYDVANMIGRVSDINYCVRARLAGEGFLVAYFSPCTFGL